MKVKFIKAVDTADIISTRLFLANELLLDPRGETFHEMKVYAESRLENLYVPNNGVVYDMNEAMWNESFLFNLKNDLEFNFSQERLALYEKVVKVVLKEKATSLDEEENKSESFSFTSGSTSTGESRSEGFSYTSSSTSTCDSDDGKKSKKKVYATITAGSAVVALTGLCLSKMALASLGAVGIVVGGMLLYNESKK